MPVTNPVAGDVHVNTPLTNFSQKYLQSMAAFVALAAMPNAPVTKQSDLYYEFDRDDFFRDEAEERADGTESQGSGFNLSTSPYFAKVWAFHKDVTDRQRANADAPVQLDESATQFVMHKLMIRRERLFASRYFATGLWGTDVTGVASGGVPGTSFNRWDTAGGDPIADVRFGARTIQGNTGMRPNRLLLGRASWDALLDNDAVLARISGGADPSRPAIVMRQLIAQLLEVEHIHVFDGIFTSTLEGVTPQVRSFIGGDNALLYYAPTTVSLNEPTAGVQFSWTGLTGAQTNGQRIKRFRMENLEADRIEGQMAFDYKLTGAALGFFFSDTNT